ncbi:MAG: M23 family metallopeptidase [bacterium]|nr:M23 family metallopeptidase [bacterium]
MTFHIKKLGVKIGIWIMHGLIAFKKGLTFLLFILSHPFRFLGYILWTLGGRTITLQIVRIIHAMRLQKTFASRPIVVLFIFLLTITFVYNFFRPSARTSRATMHEGTDIVSATSPLRALSDMDPFAQFIEVQSILPGEEENTPSIPTIAGGNALLAPTINTTRLENRLRETPEQYVVRDGDTLSDIAGQFGISISTILWENKLTLRSILHPGIELTILPVSGLSHVVARRETIASIAKRYNVEERTILDFNEIADAGSVTIGQKLIIPEGEQPKETIAALPKKRVPIAQVPRIPPLSEITVGGTRLLVPVVYKRISQWFTYRHNGIDMAGTYGTPVIAAEGGIVVQAGWGTGYGLYVLIDHGNGLMTRYGHSSKVLVSRGENVARGQTIALLGSTGRSTGPHVHFETILNGRFVNPLRYIKL